MPTTRRQVATFALPANINDLKQRMLNWSNRFSIRLLLDSCSYTQLYGEYDLILAAGVVNSYEGNPVFLQTYFNEQRDWLFGHFGYDLKNELHKGLFSCNTAPLCFPALFLFVPEHVMYVRSGDSNLVIETVGDPEALLSELLAESVGLADRLPQIEFTPVVERDEYIGTIQRLREHIRKGDCYEINYCNHRYHRGTAIDPMQVYVRLNEQNPAPYSAFYQYRQKYMMCASPERYICKRGDKVVSQPIKGTAPRGGTPEADELNKNALRNSIKEQAENVMITDLVRNDLAITCKPGSVAVEELFGIYTYPHVHQMISTVSGSLAHPHSFVDSILHSFPMGSMTGAPKHKVMQLIDTYEKMSRGLFSGSVGYISPDGDFDFNVIIRSLFYNEADKYLCFFTGGAITYDSSAEAEWEETVLKGRVLESLFK